MNTTLFEDINEFADACNQTTGGTFSISKKKDNRWQVAFYNQGKYFISESLHLAVMEAHQWLIESRKAVEVETKYTLYTIRR